MQSQNLTLADLSFNEHIHESINFPVSISIMYLLYYVCENSYFVY